MVKPGLLKFCDRSFHLERRVQGRVVSTEQARDGCLSAAGVRCRSCAWVAS